MPRTVSLGTILGLNNRLHPTRMLVSNLNRSTSAWLQQASNIDLAANGFITRRKGFALAVPGSFHSLWADATDAYAVCNGDLMRIDQRSKAMTVVQGGVGGSEVSYCRLPDGLVYWSNFQQIGRIQGATARALVTPMPNPAPVAFAMAGSLGPGRYQVCFTALGADGESPSTEPQDVWLPNGGGIGFAGLEPGMRVYVTGPDGEVFNEIEPGPYLSRTNLGASLGSLMLRPMPAGRALAHYRGSLLVARGRYLYVSEPYHYGQINLGRGYIPFPADISIVQPCEDGLYVCADKTYWIPGDPLNTAPVVVQPFGALPGSAVADPDSQTVYWQGPRGVVIAKPGGLVVTPQDAALTFSGAARGKTLVREQGGEAHVLAARFDVDD